MPRNLNASERWLRTFTNAELRTNARNLTDEMFPSHENRGTFILTMAKHRSLIAKEAKRRTKANVSRRAYIHLPAAASYAIIAAAMIAALVAWRVEYLPGADYPDAKRVGVGR